MIGTESSLQTVSFYVNGKFTSAEGRPVMPITNPATGAEIAQVAYASAADVDRTVELAHAAFLKWREVPVVDRVQPLYRYKALLEKHANELAATLTTENGKTIDDARAEVRRVHPDGGSGLRHAQPDDGRFAERRRRGHRLPYHPPADWRLRRHHAVQFSRHGADVDVAVRHRLPATRSS